MTLLLVMMTSCLGPTFPANYLMWLYLKRRHQKMEGVLQKKPTSGPGSSSDPGWMRQFKERMEGKKPKTALSMVEEKTPEPDDSQPLSDEQLEAM
eukprot:11042139-Karenia_brevis.AAC.1